MPFSEKLKKLREENHYTQKYVAKHLNVARSTIAGYETKNRQPFFNTWNSGMNPHAANQLFNPALFHKAVINIIICFFFLTVIQRH